MDKIAGYRKMLGFTQEGMAQKFGISTQAYWKKEKGDTQFNDKEKLMFKELLLPIFPNITIDEIFFSQNTKEYKEVEG